MLTLGPQQSPPSKLHSILLFSSSQYESPIHEAIHPPEVVVGPVDHVEMPVGPVEPVRPIVGVAVITLSSNYRHSEQHVVRILVFVGPVDHILVDAMYQTHICNCTQ